MLVAKKSATEKAKLGEVQAGRARPAPEGATCPRAPRKLSASVLVAHSVYTENFY